MSKHYEDSTKFIHGHQVRRGNPTNLSEWRLKDERLRSIVGKMTSKYSNGMKMMVFLVLS